MEQVFCTVVSRLRVFQALALFNSLHNVLSRFILFVLCVDDETFVLLSRLNWPKIHLVHIHDVTGESLAGLRKQRKLNEFCWTLKPIFIQSLFTTYPDLESLTFIDADLFFWNDPTLLFKRQPEAAVLLSNGEIDMPDVEDSIVDQLQDLLGKYNSGFIHFKRSPRGLYCLDWWKKKCISACLSVPEGGRFGDQKYLDEMRELPGVQEIVTPGVNIGHWNTGRHVYQFHGKRLFMDDYPLICYHFSGFRIPDRDKIMLIHEMDRIDLPFFYGIYKSILDDIMEMVERIDPEFDGFADQEDLALIIDNDQ